MSLLTMNTLVVRHFFAGVLLFAGPALLALAEDGPPAPAPATDPAAKLAETENKLATALRSYELLQKENDDLKTAAAADRAELEKLRQEKPAQAAAADPQVGELQNKLDTALRSYSLLQAENDKLRDDAGKFTADTQAASAKASTDAAAQIAGLYDELRQTQAQLAPLIAENSQLKTRLALTGPPPGSTLGAPLRPGAALPEATVPTPAADPSKPAAAPDAAPAPRTHVVVGGDNLAKISRHYYGTANRWDEILHANRDVIKDENVLPIGATLRIP